MGEHQSPVSTFNLPGAVAGVTWKTGSIHLAASWRPSDPRGSVPFALTLVHWCLGAIWGRPAGSGSSWKSTFIRRLCPGGTRARRLARLSFEMSVNSDKCWFLLGRFSLKGHNLTRHFSCWSTLTLSQACLCPNVCFEFVALDLNTHIPQQGRKRPL